jgi:hypothetical protein
MAFARSCEMNSRWHVCELMIWHLGTMLWLPHETSTSINSLIFLYEVMYVWCVYVYIYVCVCVCVCVYVCVYVYLISQIPLLLSKQKISYWIFIKHSHENEVFPLEKLLKVWWDKLKTHSRHHLCGLLLVISINNTLRWTLQKQISLNKTDSKEGGGPLIRKSFNHPHRDGWCLLKLHTKPSESGGLGRRINPGCGMWVVFPIAAQVIYQSAQTMCVVRRDFTSKTKGGGLPSTRRVRKVKIHHV